MRILEFMSFDPSWFLTVPGLLISGGVLLLLIALIVFITTSKKDKGKTVDPTVEGSIPVVGGPEDINNGMANAMNNGIPTDMNNMINSGVVNNPMVNTMGMMDNGGFNQVGTINLTPNAVDNDMNPGPMPVMPEVAPAPQVMTNIAPPVVPTPVANDMVNPEPVMPVNTNISFDNVPQATINDTVNPEMQPVLDLGNVSPNPVVDLTNNTPTPVVPSVEKPQENTFINNNARPIYGGANPLENTASIPTVTNHSAYNGEPIIPNSVVNEVKVVDNNTTTPINAADIFAGANGVPTPAPAVETIVAPTPIEVNPEPLEGNASIQNPTPVVNQAVQPADTPVETLDF